MSDTPTSSKLLRVLIFLADNGQDPTEVAVPWSILVANGITVDFATENGMEALCDPRMISGAVGALLGASSSAKALYGEMTSTPGWKDPLSWKWDTFPQTLDSYDGVLLPGGHDKPIRQYLQSPSLQSHLAAFFPLTNRTAPKPKVVAAICHGVLALARSKDAQGKSVLYNVKTTTLPVHMEKSAYFATAAFLGNYYRTYEEYTADEVQSLLASPSQYENGGVLNTSPFVVIDPTHYYVSARFPGDAEKFANTFVELLKEAAAK